METSDEFLQIDTPENVVFGYEIAGIGSRFLAALIDTLIIGVIQFIVILTIVALANLPGLNGEAGSDSISPWIFALYALLSFVLLWGYYIAFEFVWNGQTPGKRAMKLRVIRSSGTPVTLTEVLVRNLVRLIDFMPVSYGVGVVSMFVSKQSQRLGDLAAGTIVVWDHSEVSLDSIRGKREPAGRATSISPPTPAGPTMAAALANHLEAPPPPSFPVERLTAQDIHMMEEYLRRRFEIANSRGMALQIVRVVRQHMGMSPDLEFGQQPERWLTEVLAAYHHQRQ